MIGAEVQVFHLAKERLGKPRAASRFLLVALLAKSVLAVPAWAQPSGVLEKLEQDISYIVEKVKPCVVTVTGYRYQQAAETAGPRHSLLSFLRREEVPDRADTSNVVQVHLVGSGLVYDTLGHVVTRSSVVLGSDGVWVTFMDGRRAKASYVGCDVETGIAVILVEARGLNAVPVSESPLRPGSWVTIVGNSLGITPSVSVGLVNGIRSDGLVQLSANLNPGLAGSPAFDSQGRLVGILMASISPGGEVESVAGGAFSGTALLCPMRFVRRAVEMILSRRMDTRGWVGLTVERQETPVRGIRVVDVAPNSPAELAGLRSGDVIVRVGPDRTQSITELLRHLADARPGEVLDFTVLRGGKPWRALVEVMERPDGGDFHVEVESGCGATFLTKLPRADTNGFRTSQPATASPSDLELRIQRLEAELRQLKARVK